MKRFILSTEKPCKWLWWSSSTFATSPHFLFCKWMKLGRWTSRIWRKWRERVKNQFSWFMLKTETIFSQGIAPSNHFFRQQCLQKSFPPSGPKSYMSLEVGSPHISFPSSFWSKIIKLIKHLSSNHFQNYLVSNSGRIGTVYLSKIHSLVMFSSELSSHSLIMLC